ncbi:MerR family transcriptional regulator [Qingshengfaniella alkalisoli]|uniref:MerR family DNA-binding transcriptional regulator n=1 Tax=Qingshengfaniella alkalisoli TaxID=2599296 RepID=A0A5B8IVL9_9RHOB|nr:MerR family DNA-binding transcriptional regulator [Qingshengfaniella alkalisoli]QDY68548.1 MerR family DNA-binding transcriptional regulator [Qingshengfaniella alkalisoli]
MTEKTMTIREMCDEFQVTARTLRFYEAKELLAPVRIGQKRLFTKADRGRLKLILRGKRFGFSLEEIRQLLDLYDADKTGATQLEAFNKLGAARLEGLKAEREDLGKAIDELNNLLKWTKDQHAELTGSKAA